MHGRCCRIYSYVRVYLALTRGNSMVAENDIHPSIRLHSRSHQARPDSIAHLVACIINGLVRLYSNDTINDLSNTALIHPHMHRSLTNLSSPA